MTTLTTAVCLSVRTAKQLFLFSFFFYSSILFAYYLLFISLLLPQIMVNRDYRNKNVHIAFLESQNV